jgi:hypothetical protein
MQLHSKLKGRAGAFRVHGEAWERNPLSFTGFLHIVPIGDAGDGRHRVVEAEGETMWKLLEALCAQVVSTAGSPVQRLDAHAVAKTRSTRRTAPGSGAGEGAAHVLPRGDRTGAAVEATRPPPARSPRCR